MEKQNRKIFGTLFFALFNAVLGVGIVIPLLPVYAHSLGASGFYISMIFGSFSLSRTFLLPYFGRLADKKGRKPLITIGLFSFAVVSIGFLYSSSVFSLIFIRFLQGIGSAMIMPATLAYVGDITPEGKEGTYMGLFNMSMFISLSIGPLIGGYINQYISLQATFICMGVLAMSGFLIAAIFLPPTSQEQCMVKPKPPPDWRVILKNRAVTGIFTYRLTHTVAIAAVWCFIPVFADAEFRLSSAAIGILVTATVLTSGILNTPMGILADYTDKRLMILVGGIMSALALLFLNWTQGFWSLLTAVIAFGLGGGLVMPAIGAIAVIEGNREKALGTVMATLNLAQSLGMLFGSIVAGLAMDYIGVRYSFVFAGLIVIVGLLASMLLLRGIPCRTAGVQSLSSNNIQG